MISGYRIFRGYKELCNAADRLPDVTHAVFVVHGVGGVMDEGTIGRNAALMRDNVSHILTKCFPKFQEQSGQRVEFFPVEWRTNLRLDEGLVDAITPQRVMGLRFVRVLQSSRLHIPVLQDITQLHRDGHHVLHESSLQNGDLERPAVRTEQAVSNVHIKEPNF